MSTPRSRFLILAVAGTLTLSLAGRANADEAGDAFKDMEKTFGSVPSFMHKFPKAGVAGAWAEVKALEFSDQTALSPKTKALISLAVAAQIPCTYCIYSDTESAKKAGASEQEIEEAVAISALTRHWSTIFNGMQIDLDQFKKEMAGP